MTDKWLPGRPVRLWSSRPVCVPEFGADGPGFALHDPEVDHMATAYSAPGAAYFVVVDEGGRVVGGAGVAALEGGEAGVCELRKMYFLP